MTQLCLIHTAAGSDCVAAIENQLMAAGYTLWQYSEQLTPDRPHFQRALGYGLIGSVAAILLWDAATAADATTTAALSLAHTLYKPIHTITLDVTPLPPTLADHPTHTAQPPCEQAAAALLAALPPADDTPYTKILAQLTSHIIRDRRAGIARAADMLAQPGHQQELLAALVHIATHDTIQNIRAAAQAALDKHTQTAPPTPDFGEDGHHVIGVRCVNNHISYYDRREICPASSTFKRTLVRRAGQTLDELLLPCRHQGCHAKTVVEVDCEGYK